MNERCAFLCLCTLELMGTETAASKVEGALHGLGNLPRKFEEWKPRNASPNT